MVSMRRRSQLDDVLSLSPFFVIRVIWLLKYSSIHFVASPSRHSRHQYPLSTITGNHVFFPHLSHVFFSLMLLTLFIQMLEDASAALPGILRKTRNPHRGMRLQTLVPILRFHILPPVYLVPSRVPSHVFLCFKCPLKPFPTKTVLLTKFRYLKNGGICLIYFGLIVILTSILQIIFPNTFVKSRFEGAQNPELVRLGGWIGTGIGIFLILINLFFGVGG
ncbi:hypothetical protein ABH899_000483 [Paenibacillus sp. RC84]